MRSLGIELLARADLFVENRNRGWRSTIAPADSHRRVHPMFNCLLQATHSDPRLIWPHPIPPSQRARFLGTLVVAHAVAGVPIRPRRCSCVRVSAQGLCRHDEGTAARRSLHRPEARLPQLPTDVRAEPVAIVSCVARPPDHDVHVHRGTAAAYPRCSRNQATVRFTAFGCGVGWNGPKDRWNLEASNTKGAVH
jgi:hypothetical protein